MDPRAPKQRLLTDEAYNKEFTVKFTRRELVVLNNLIRSQQYTLENAAILINIVDKFHDPLVVNESDYEKDPTEATKEVQVN